MKKIFVIALVAMAGTAGAATGNGMVNEMASAKEAASSPVATVARKTAEVMLGEAVKAGYGTAKDKEAVLRSGIVEEVANTLVETNFDFVAAVDKAAEVSVRQGWFKNKAAAKAALRQACERARKDTGLVQRVYRMLGI